MKRIALTDGSNTWFDAERATLYKELSRWDGNNWVSVATGSQWRHEHLYHTASGRWVLNFWSDYSGELGDHYQKISDHEAYDWLIKNQEFDALPENELSDREVGAGDSVQHVVNISDELYNQLQSVAFVEDTDINTLIGKVVNEFVARHRITRSAAIA